MCQWALTERRTLGRVGAPQRGNGAPLEPLAQLGDALSGVGARAVTVVADATKYICTETAMGTRAKVSVGADTKANAFGQRRTPARSQSSP